MTLIRSTQNVIRHGLHGLKITNLHEEYGSRALHLARLPLLEPCGVVNTLKQCRRCMAVRTLIKESDKKQSFQERGYILLVIPITAFCLGTWQVKRRKWKLGLIADLEERTNTTPVPFPDDLDELKELEYKRVVVKGHFDHSKELYVRPRSFISPDPDKGGSGLFSAGGTSGAHIVTPFHLSDKNMTILVNRGWVKKDRSNPKKRQDGQVEGEMEFVGIVRMPEKRPPFGGKDDQKGNQWINRDIDAMAESAGTAPAFIDAVNTIPGGPIGGQTRVTLRNEHLSYLLTWYSLCLITSVMWMQRYMKR